MHNATLNKVLFIMALWTIPGYSHAAFEYFELRDAVFSDGGTASGLLTIEAVESGNTVQRNVVEANLITLAGTSRDYELTYTNGNWEPGYTGPGIIGSDLGLTFYTTNPFGETVYWFMSTDLPYTEVLNLPGSPAYTEGCTGIVIGGCGRFLVSGYLSQVPIPAAAWLFASGILGLIGIKRFNQPLKGMNHAINSHTPPR